MISSLRSELSRKQDLPVSPSTKPSTLIAAPVARITFNILSGSWLCSCWHKVISNIIGKATFSAQIDCPLAKMIWNRSPSFTTLIFKILNIHHLEQDCQNHQGFPTSPCSLTLSQKCNRSWRKYFDRISSAECMEGSINILTLTYLSKLSVFLIVNFFTCSPTFAGRQLGRVGLYGLLSYNVTDIFEGLRQNF